MRTFFMTPQALVLLVVLAGVSCQIRSFSDDVDLTTVTTQEVDAVLANKAAVLQLVECFLYETLCRSRGALSFVRQVKRLGPRGRCYRCSARQQGHLDIVTRHTIFAMQRYHPVEYSRILPYIRHILY
ncbi:uncharacterized protein LOC108674213 [Hyalella azteca]|uniref:Uncharacterized protein LOC108674213 n=1 Tax=Hyalella azteca TaxID=294128 RepID=A0A8B7NV60_HYAAZ|nr:uncharacterized protein LOC108674213 [Hyalella azteca]